MLPRPRKSSSPLSSHPLLQPWPLPLPNLPNPPSLPPQPQSLLQPLLQPPPHPPPQPHALARSQSLLFKKGNPIPPIYLSSIFVVFFYACFYSRTHALDVQNEAHLNLFRSYAVGHHHIVFNNLLPI